MTGDQLYLGHPVHSAPGPVHSNARTLTSGSTMHSNARTLTSGSTMQVVVTMTVPKDTKANATAAVNPGGAWVALGLYGGPRSPCSVLGWRVGLACVCGGGGGFPCLLPSEGNYAQLYCRPLSSSSTCSCRSLVW
jgi:hypothetical protein